MNYLFTSESVSEGHPDKVADSISDAVLDNFLAFDPQSKVACETLVTTGQVVIAGEVKSQAYVELMEVARGVIAKIGYTRGELKFQADSCGVFSALHEQSPDINRGVDVAEPAEQGAGDQGMMFGYACTETKNYMPLTLDLAHLLLRELAELRKGRLLPYLRPDAKCQVTVEYDGETHRPVRVHTIVISTQHDEFVDAKREGITEKEAERRMLERIGRDMRDVLLPRVFSELSKHNPEVLKLFSPNVVLNPKDHSLLGSLELGDRLLLLVNPTGKFVIGGPHGDTGLTGRKIIVDTYGGRGAHGGGAFSGKDPSKVDRSAAYAARYIAKNAVAAGVADEMLVQISYAIGVPEPVSFFVNTYGTSHVAMTDAEIADVLRHLFKLRPHDIEQELKLRNPIYEETATYGHMGREPEQVTKTFTTSSGEVKKVTVDLFTWEALDRKPIIKAAFNLK